MDSLRTVLRRHRKDLKEYFVLFGKTAVAVSVVLHMAAVLAFSVPSAASGWPASFLRDTVNPQLGPYLLMTSQWQEWNLFAPDPQRQVRTFAVDAEDGVRWKTVASFGPGAFPWWRHATYAKLLPAALMKERLDYDVFRERFLQILCNDLGLAPNVMVRLRENMKMIPYTDTHQTDTWWDAQDTNADTTVIHITNCNASFR